MSGCGHEAQTSGPYHKDTRPVTRRPTHAPWNWASKLLPWAPHVILFTWVFPLATLDGWDVPKGRIPLPVLIKGMLFQRWSGLDIHTQTLHIENTLN